MVDSFQLTGVAVFLKPLQRKCDLQHVASGRIYRAPVIPTPTVLSASSVWAAVACILMLAAQPAGVIVLG